MYYLFLLASVWDGSYIKPAFLMLGQSLKTVQFDKVRVLMTYLLIFIVITTLTLAAPDSGSTVTSVSDCSRRFAKI